MERRFKHGQFDMPIIWFIVLIAFLIVLSPFVLKITKAILEPMGNSLAEISPMANASALYAVEATTTFWDMSMMIVFIILVIFMMISAYFVDVHPIFAVISIFLGFFMFMTIPAMSELFGGIYNVAELTNETAALPMMNWLQLNFGIVVLIVYILTGVIMFGKLRMRAEGNI